MITRLLSLLSLTVACIFSFGQNSPEIQSLKSGLIDPYRQYFSLPREQVYTHFNKSCYLPNDAIWFKCYVIDPETKLPSLITKNLIVELYNPDGKLLSQKILYVNNGVADNVFLLKADQRPGKYTFRAYTNWMRNFNSPDQFISYIPVLGDETPDELPDSLHYDIQFFAESGTLLEGSLNKIAIKATDPNGKGVKLKGEIFDEKGDTVTSFDLNNLGMGSITLNAIPGSVYTGRFKLPDGKTASYSLPPVEKKGVIAQVNPFFKNKILIQVTSNEQTIDTKRLFYLVIHTNGTIARSAFFHLDPKNTTQSIEFNKAELMNGVNCLTIFNDAFQPVAERLFFVKNAEIKGKINIENKFTQDSLSMVISALDSTGKPAIASLSLSVLPEGSRSNQFTTSLLAEVLLSSGVRGFIENPHYYIEHMDFEHQLALDNLLLSQGWRKYNWKEILAKKPPTPKYVFEQGFSIQGNIKNWLNGKLERNSQVAFFSPANGFFNIVQADSLGGFSFPKLYLADSTSLFLSASNNKGKGWNRSITSSLIPLYKADSSLEKPRDYQLQSIVSEAPPPKLIPGVIQLKEVKIIGKKKEEPFRNTLYRPVDGRYFEITQENYYRYNRIEDLLMAEFNVRVFMDSGEYSVDMGRGQSSLFQKTQPVLIIDDMPMQDLSWLGILNITEIEAISVNKSGDPMLGMNGASGSIIIKTRRTPIDWGYIPPTNISKIKVKGYANPVAYYTPKYALTPSSAAYTRYATIFWQPGIETDSLGKATIKFAVPKEIRSLEVRIEGFSKNGTLFLEENKVHAIQ